MRGEPFGGVLGKPVSRAAQKKAQARADEKRSCERCAASMSRKWWERPSAFLRRRFCSNACSSVSNLGDRIISKKVTVSCKNCGNSVSRKRSEGGCFCSSACCYEWRRNQRPTCVVCGQQRSRLRNTCSSKCGYELRKSKLRKQKTCPHCGVLFWPRIQAHGARSKHCSLKCALAVKALRPAFVSATCAGCGTTFRRTSAAIKRTKRSFCSSRCAKLFNRGENHTLYRGDKDPNRGAAWVRLAESIRKRDGYCCQRCNRTQAENKQRLSVDHILPWRSFKDKAEANNPSNLISLCRRCHSIKTTVFERLWLKGDRVGMDQYRRAIQLPPLFAQVTS